MSAQNARDAADEFVALLRLRPEDKGRKYCLVTFASDEDCRFFYPRRALDWQRQVNTYISRALRERGIRVQRLALKPEDYWTWMKQQSAVQHPDAPSPEESKRKFSDAQLHFLEPVE